MGGTMPVVMECKCGNPECTGEVCLCGESCECKTEENNQQEWADEWLKQKDSMQT